MDGWISTSMVRGLQLEGQLQDDSFFDLADEYGVMILPGWPCCDAFQHWPAWTTETLAIAKASLTSQVRWMFSIAGLASEFTARISRGNHLDWNVMKLFRCCVSKPELISRVLYPHCARHW